MVAAVEAWVRFLTAANLDGDGAALLSLSGAWKRKVRGRDEEEDAGAGWVGAGVWEPGAEIVPIGPPLVDPGPITCNRAPRAAAL